MIRKHTKRRGAVSIAVVVLVVVVLVIAHRRGYLRGPESLLQGVLLPVESALTTVDQAVSARVGRVVSLWDADERLQEAEQQLSAMEAEHERLRAVERENAFLREQLRLSPTPPLRAVLATIVAINPTVTNTLLLDAGSDAGVVERSPVLVNGALFGYIVSVQARTSQLRLLTDPKSVVEATVPEAKARGALYGTIGQRDLVLREIPRGVGVAPGMSVLAEGQEDAPHPPLVVGTVSDVEDDPKATNLTVRVRPTTRPRDVDQVLIVLQQ